MVWPLVPKDDRWAAQVEAAFSYLFNQGFRVVYRDTYRLGEASTVGNQFAGVHLDADFDSNFVDATLLRLDHGQMPERWWAPQTPRVSLGLREVAAVLAPEVLDGIVDLPRLRREADRAPHLQFWSRALSRVAAPWLQGDREWFDRTERLLAGR